DPAAFLETRAEINSHFGPLVSGAKLAPKGRDRKAQGASPGFKVQIAESPERATQGFGVELQINVGHKGNRFDTGTTASPLWGFRCCSACSQGSRPGLSCWTRSGSPEFSRQKSDWIASAGSGRRQQPRFSSWAASIPCTTTLPEPLLARGAAA